MTGYVERMLRAAKLDVQLYEEVEADRTAMPQAMGVVVLSSLAAGIGTLGMGQANAGTIVIGIVSALVGWYIWALLTYLIGTKILPEPQTKSDIGELLRTTGFSSSPGLVRLVGVIPGLGGIIFWIAAVWMLIAMVIAVRQALDYSSTWRAVGVCAIGWLIQAVVLMVVLSFFVNPGSIPAQ